MFSSNFKIDDPLMAALSWELGLPTWVWNACWAQPVQLFPIYLPCQINYLIVLVKIVSFWLEVIHWRCHLRLIDAGFSRRRPGHFMWDSWRTKWHWNKVFTCCLWFPPLNSHSTIALYSSFTCLSPHLADWWLYLWPDTRLIQTGEVESWCYIKLHNLRERERGKESIWGNLSWGHGNKSYGRWGYRPPRLYILSLRCIPPLRPSMT
jgi:hypothetical protein